MIQSQPGGHHEQRLALSVLCPFFVSRDLDRISSFAATAS